MNRNEITALIVDDERSARNELGRLLAHYPQVRIIDEASDGIEALEKCQKHHPDILFLDIQMPGLTGFELLEKIESLTEVIFVTAFDNYAIRAFEVSALDYLLKPIRTERFEKTMDKVLERFDREKKAGVFVKDRGRYFHIYWSQVHLIESMDNYCKLYFDKQSVLIKSSLTKLEANPACSRFFRASRSFLFNLNFVQSILQKGNRLEVTLTTGDAIMLSERKSVIFKKHAKT
ncbi:response regulator [Marinilongibacter aquaticus]|uniref:LytR/AlgR family response regulator transcription factor n=1 Tax=Marinilongibacter aquaticus TaxID=2975157 RepID=UPI0021BD8206|nr:response regulator [Marinilongibacter aquaticus]UBM58786.1 response regulator [Marinilongibacter aquaticus]